MLIIPLIQYSPYFLHYCSYSRIHIICHYLQLIVDVQYYCVYLKAKRSVKLFELLGLLLLLLLLMLHFVYSGTIVHTLVGGGGQHGGFDALDYRKIKHGDAGKLGKYDILSVLPDKMARFLYEFHDFRFSSLNLPPLPADRSDFDVHGAIDNDQV